MIRKHASTSLLAAALLQASLAQGLGLGEIDLHTSLDQPLSADIRLRGVRDLDASQIIVGLASQADFERAGVERLFFLTDIRFEVQLSGDEGTLHVSTEHAIREPYLDFVVEVRWPSGRVLREYTVLIDLPTYKPEPAEQVSAPAAPGPARSAPAPAVRRESTGAGYTVARNDTLWGIASRSRPDGVTVQRMMVAIHRDNPDAFIRGNINLIKAGQVLRIPDSSEISGVSQSEATRTVLAHDRDWRSGSAPIDKPSPASEPAPASQPQAQADADAYLHIAGDTTAEGSGAAAGGVGSEGGVAPGAATPEQLAAAAENLSAAERTNADLQSRVAALEEQVHNYERLVELKSDAAAAAQAQVEPAAATPSSSDVTTMPVPPAEQPALIDRLLGNTMVLASAAGIALLAVLVLLFSRRRGDYVPIPERTLREPIARPLEPAARSAPRDADAEHDAPPAEKALFGAPARALSSTEQETGDALSEADIYIAYGKRQSAIDVLEKALVADPERHDLRLKLMEIHANHGDEAGFVGEYERLQAFGAPGALREARALIEGTEHAHWLREIKTAPEQDEEPRLATARLDDESLVSDEPDYAEEEEDLAPEEELALDLELGELELDGSDIVNAQPEERPSLEEFELPADLVSSGMREMEDEFDLVGTSGETETKLELARAYMDMGDMDGARDILEEVVAEGTQLQRDEANKMLERLRS